MPIKVFTILGGKCPHRGCEFDSQTCRTCQYFYRTGTATFFWCNHPVEAEAAPTPKKSPEIDKPKRKRGRPPGKAAKKPVKRTKIKK